MAHLSFVNNDTFDISKVSIDKRRNKFYIHQVLYDGKPLVYQTPKFYMFSNVFKISKEHPIYMLNLFNSNDETNKFFNNSRMFDGILDKFVDYSDIIPVKRGFLPIKYHNEKYGFVEKKSRDIECMCVGFKYRRGELCEVMKHYNGVKTIETISEEHVRGVIPRYSFISCDIIPIVYMQRNGMLRGYHGLAWKIAGISVHTPKPDFYRKWIDNVVSETKKEDTKKKTEKIEEVSGEEPPPES